MTPRVLVAALTLTVATAAHAMQPLTPPPATVRNPAYPTNLYPPGIAFNPVVDYTLPNFAQSPNLRKFVNKMPGLGAPNCTVGSPLGTGSCNENELGQYIPVAQPDTTSYPGSATTPAADYYELGIRQYTRQMHADLPASGSSLRGYYQKNGVDHSQQYLGPLILARRNRPVRLKVWNELGLSTSASNPYGAGDLPLPADPTLMGAGMGPLTPAGTACTGMGCAQYTQNRATIHLHGGATPWISDGTPHQWFTPANDPTVLKKGASFQNVPDMVTGSGVACAAVPPASCFAPAATDGVGTYYYTNQQSGRLLFYHDHAYGITRLNVYDGMAAPYLLVDQVEDDLIDGTNNSGGNPAGTRLLPSLPGVYRYGIPLVIQDKSFVNDASTPPGPGFPAAVTGYVPSRPTLSLDDLWQYYVGTGGGNLWMSHEYMPVENPFDPSGQTPNGRWDYSAFVIPPALPMNLTLPSPTLTPEAFMDTAVVNGTAFPYLELPPDAVRFRILNAANDRTLNLQLYKADPLRISVTEGGSGYSASNPPAVTIASQQPGNVGSYGSATAIVNAAGNVTAIAVTGAGGYRSDLPPPVVTIAPPGTAGTRASAVAFVNTELKMVPAAPNSAYPTWPRDGRDGGVPDPTTAGPPWLQIGNESGLLARLAIWPQQPVDYEYNRQNLVAEGVTSRSLYLMPAMRADVIVDLSQYKDGDTLIVYNDAPAPMPNFWPFNDYFTDAPDLTAIGGAPPTPPGFGPNTRTVMQIRIKGTKSSSFDFSTDAKPGFDRYTPNPSGGVPIITSMGPSLTALVNALPKAFAVAQPKPLVPQTAYNDAFPGFATFDTFGQGYTDLLNLTGAPQPVSRIKATLPGNGYATPPTVTIVGGNCSVHPAATAGLNPVGGITLLTAGAGYTTPPTVTIGAPRSTYTAPAAPPAGTTPVTATALATVSGGAVTALTLDEPGSYYNTNAADRRAVATCTIAPPPCTINGTTCVRATCSTFIAAAGTVGSIRVTTPGLCQSQPLVYLTGAMPGMGASATAMLAGSLVFTGKNMTEGFDPDYGRMDIRLGSTPNPLTPNVGNGQVVGVARYIDPPTEILNDGETILWRLTHLGVDAHAMHFHLFDVQVVNRVDMTNVIKAPWQDEIGWRETIRTNPMEDVLLAIKPVSFNLPFPVPNSSRVLDPTTPVNSMMNFLPVPPPPGVPAVPQVTNAVTNFGWEYVWHCHLLEHEENDMMRPIALVVTPPLAPTALTASVSFPTPDTAQVVLNWSAAGSNARGYVIQRSTSSTFPAASTVTFGVNTPFPTPATTFTDTTAIPNTVYYYRVAATNGAGTSPYSATLTVPVVEPPLNFSATVTTGAASDSVTLTWSAPGSPASFTIQRLDFSTGLNSYTAAGTARSFTQTGLAKGSNYYYRIRTNLAVGSSAYTAEILVSAP